MWKTRVTLGDASRHHNDVETLAHGQKRIAEKLESLDDSIRELCASQRAVEAAVTGLQARNEGADTPHILEAIPKPRGISVVFNTEAEEIPLDTAWPGKSIDTWSSSEARLQEPDEVMTDEEADEAEDEAFRPFDRRAMARTRFTAYLEHPPGEEEGEEEEAAPRLSVATESTELAVLPVSLPVGWPKELAIRSQLLNLRNRVDSDVHLSNKRSSIDFFRRGRFRPEAHDDGPRCTIDPESRFSLFIELASAVMLVIDLITIPYVLAWEVPLSGFHLLFSWFASVFWTLDIVRIFLTSVRLSGEKELQTNLRVIAVQYMRSWFLPDAVVVACDWTNMYFHTREVDSQGTTAIFKMLRIAKISRLIRLAKLVRMSRLARRCDDLIDLYVSGGWRVSLKIFGILIVVLWFNHAISCLWYAIGKNMPTDTGGHWLGTGVAINGVTYGYGELNDLYVYSTAFHWSMAQMTLGSSEIVSANAPERAFSIFMLLMGLLFSSTLVSTLSATLVDYQMQASDHKEKMRQLARFLGQNKVDMTLALRVRKQVVQRLTQKPKLTDKEVTALECLSSSMRAELRFEIFKDHLMRHPLFRVWTNISSVTVTELCADELDFTFFQEADDIFHPGNECEMAYYIAEGTVVYTQDPESAVVSTQVVETVREAWMCEAALWTEWVHVGRAHASEPLQLLQLPATRVLDVLKKHRLIQEITLDYSQQFHRRVTDPPAGWPTDLRVPLTDFSDIVTLMNPDLQCTIGLDALMHISVTHMWGLRHAPYADRLKEEILEGRSVVVLDGRGEPERAVSVTALRIKHDDGVSVLMQLGKLVGSQLVTKCVLPGTKQERHERPTDAADRIVREKLYPLKDDLKIVSSDLNVENQVSGKFRIPTKYFRTEVCMKFIGGAFSKIGCTSGISWPGFSDILSALSSREVYAFAAKEDYDCRALDSDIHAVSSATYFFAWLLDEERELLSWSENEAALHAWISTAVSSAHIVVCDEGDSSSCVSL